MPRSAGSDSPYKISGSDTILHWITCAHNDVRADQSDELSVLDGDDERTSSQDCMIVQLEYFDHLVATCYTGC